jgi:hypothetical protein
MIIQHVAARKPISLPDPIITHGQLASMSPVCGRTDGLRHWTRERDDAVLKAYGLPPGPHPKYQIDHLIPLCLGGADTLANLWPQPKDEAILKDKLEIRVCEVVCDPRVVDHKVTQAAQIMFARDWVYLYRTVFEAEPE